MEKYNNLDFYNRINALIQGRKLTPWVLGLGFARGMVTSLKEGRIPHGDTLALIARVENANLNWLLNGLCNPFRTVGFITHTEAVEYCTALFDENWHCHQSVLGEQLLAVFSQPGAEYVNDKPLAYTLVEIVVSPRHESLESLLPHCPGGFTQAALSPPQHRAIARGEVGSWQLFKPGGLLAETAAGGVAEPENHYAPAAEKSPLTAGEAALLKKLAAKL